LLRHLLLAARQLLIFSFADRVVPHVGLRGIRCGGVRIRCADGCERVRVGAVVPRCVCECEHPEGAREKAPTTWPRRERDVAAASRGWTRTARPGHWHGKAGPRQGEGRAEGRQHGLCSRQGCARTHAGPGFPGPRRGRAVRGAPAPRACGTVRRREGTAAAGMTAARRAPAQEWRQGREGKGS
jgi:hypothetical protein